VPAASLESSGNRLWSVPPAATTAVAGASAVRRLGVSLKPPRLVPPSGSKRDDDPFSQEYTSLTGSTKVGNRVSVALMSTTSRSEPHRLRNFDRLADRQNYAPVPPPAVNPQEVTPKVKPGYMNRLAHGSAGRETSSEIQ